MPGALASLPHGAHILVVDAGSRDRTRSIATAAGATVLERPWSDFVEARRFALSHVTTPWTFMLDADERLDESLRKALSEADPEPAGLSGYRVRRATRFCGKVVRAFGWDRESLVRVFRTDSAVVVAHPVSGGAAPVHERWDVKGRLDNLNGTLLHDSYPDRAAYRRKFERYTSLEAAGLQPRADAFVWSAAVALPRFLWLFGGRSGFRMGWRGAYLAFWSALYPAVAQWKALRGRD